jgi:hypothetical protein
MSTTKHKFFKILITNSSDFDYSKESENELNTFLSENNVVYVNHSVSIFHDSKQEYNHVLNVPKYLLVSLVYKDLNESPMDLKKSSIKTEKLVKKSVENNDEIIKSSHSTSFEKKLKK